MIWRVPESEILILGPGNTGAPSLYQVITGGGLPIAEHGRTAMDFTGNVWLVGPSVMMGGGWSSGEVTVNRALHVTDPAGLTAEQTTTDPVSFRVTDWNKIPQILYFKRDFLNWTRNWTLNLLQSRQACKPLLYPNSSIGYNFSFVYVISETRKLHCSYFTGFHNLISQLIETKHLSETKSHHPTKPQSRLLGLVKCGERTSVKY